MASNKNLFEQAIMAAYTNILNKNVLHTLFEEACNHITGYTELDIIEIKQWLNDRSWLSNKEKPHSLEVCLDNIKNAIKANMQPNTVKNIILDLYKKTNECDISTLLLKEIDQYIISPNQQDGSRISEIHSIIIGTFEKLYPGDDSFAPPSAQPSNLNEFLKSQIQSCMACLLEYARLDIVDCASSSQVCLK
jgi:hypothetical protein